MISMSDVSLPDKAMRQQISSAINVIVQQARMSDGSRKITSISEIAGMEGDVITMQEVFKFEKTGLDDTRQVRGRFMATGVRPQCSNRMQAAGIALDPTMFEGVTEV